MKRFILASVLAASFTCALPQGEQLAKWINVPNEIDFRSANPTQTTLQGAPSNTGGSYNCWYEDGTLLFYVLSDGYIYRANHTWIGRVDGYQMSYIPLALHGEIAVFPHTDNFRDVCSKKFWVIANGKTSTSPTGGLYTVMLNFNAGPGNTMTNSSFSSTNINDESIAVGKLRANGNRFVYLSEVVAGTTKLRAYDFPAGNNLFTLPSHYSNLLYTGASVSGEMELSNAGDRLAYVDSQNGFLQILTLNPTTGIPVGPITSLPVSGVKGIEFNQAGTQLLFTGTYNSVSGIHYFDFSSSTINTMANTQIYAGGLLEKSFSNASLPSRIICSNGGSFNRLNTSGPTPSFDSWSLNVGNTFMPDQVDGEDVNSKLLTVTPLQPYKHVCTPGNFTYTYTLHPYAQQYSSLFSIANYYIGNYAGVFPQANWTLYSNPPVSVGSETLYLSSTSSFGIFLYNTSNPGCSEKMRTFSFYILPCATIGTFNTNPGSNPYGKTTLHTNPLFPDEETNSPGFGNTWTFQELDPETFMPVYSITDEDCWKTEPGMGSIFPGFDNEINDYTSTGFTCAADEGQFVTGKTYRIVRTVWADGIDPYIVEDVFDLQDDGTLKSLTNAAVTSTDHSVNTQVYPNPSNGSINVKTNLAVPGSIAVYDAMGARVMETRVGDQQQVTTLDLSHLSRGMYTVKIASGKTVEVQKIVLQ